MGKFYQFSDSCEFCKGSGRKICFRCNGNGQELDYYLNPRYKSGMQTVMVFCYDCGGKKENDCKHCDGTGEIRNSQKEQAYAYCNQGITYWKQGKYNLAIADCNKAISLNPDDFLAYFTRGNAYYTQGRHDLAIADFNKAISLNSDNAYPYNSRGNVYHTQGRHDLAIADFNKALEIGGLSRKLRELIEQRLRELE